MRVNPVLGTLSLGDLNQRYESSYAVYKGRPTFIGGFSGTNSKPEIFGDSIVRSFGGGFEGFREMFNWEDLDVSRPPSGWYMVSTADGLKPVHLAYNIMRQWKRGLCHRNTTMLSTEESVMRGDAMYDILAAGDDEIPNRRVTVEEVVETKGTFIPRQRVLIETRGRETHILLATRKVAVLEPKKKRIRVIDTFDPIEVQDVLIAPKWEIVPIPQFEKRQRMYNVVARKGGGGVGFDIAAALREGRRGVPAPEEEFDHEPDEPQVPRPASYIAETFYSVLDRGGGIERKMSKNEVLDDVFLFFTDFLTRLDLDVAFYPAGLGYAPHPFGTEMVNPSGGPLWVIAEAPTAKASIHSVSAFSDMEFDRIGIDRFMEYYQQVYNKSPRVDAYPMFINHPRTGRQIGVLVYEVHPTDVGRENLVFTCFAFV